MLGKLFHKDSTKGSRITNEGDSPQGSPKGQSKQSSSPSTPGKQGSQGQMWRSMSDFRDKEEIASGRASTVYAATCVRTGMHCAVKAYTKALLSQGNLQQVHREITLLDATSGNHPNICRVLGSFEDKDNIYLVQEFCDRGDVLQLLMDSGGRMSEQDAVQNVIVPLLLALKHIHSYGIIHRDIKPENLFVDGKGIVKLGDFGLAVNILEELPVARIGTLDYMAPEVLMLPVNCDPDQEANKKPYNQQVDAWACGILTYELLVGKPPFEVADEAVTCAMIIWSELPSDRSGWPAHLSDEVIDFVQQSLTKCPENRITVDKMLQHPWIRRYVSSKQLVNTAAIISSEIADSMSKLGFHDNSAMAKTASPMG